VATKATTKPTRSPESRLKERQGLLLLALLARPDGIAAQKDLRPAPEPVVRRLLERLSAYMAAREVALSDLLGPQRGTPPASVGATIGPEADDPAPSDLPARIRAAYLAVTGGRLNTRALLKSLRPHLPDVAGETLDATLKAMQAEGAARLYRIDDRAEITQADRAAAVEIAGEPRHILWIER